MILLDPLDEVIPFGILNPSSLNDSGLLIREDQTQIVDILPDNMSSVQTTTLMTLNEQGHVSVDLRSNYSGYDGIVQRKLSEEDDEQTYLEEYHLDNAPGSDIISFELANTEDTSSPFTVEASIENQQYATQAGDMIYINPFFKDRMSENPFSNPDREFPVEFNYGSSKSFTTTLNLPDGYEVVDIPANATHRFSDNAGFSFIRQVSNNMVQMRLTIVNNEITVDTDRYQELREYYATLSEFFNQQIVLRKTADEPGNSGANSTDNSSGN
jgi:hypothetical protein